MKFSANLGFLWTEFATFAARELSFGEVRASSALT